MIAVGMNGEALPREHGFPVRMVVPGLYGFISASKWLTRMTLTTYDEQEAYWTERDWATDAPIKISSRIDTPKSFDEHRRAARPSSAASRGRSTAASARSRSRSTAAPGSRPSSARRAGVDYWRQWYLPWTPSPASTTSSVRATDRDGEVQTAAQGRRRSPTAPAATSEIIVTRRPEPPRNPARAHRHRTTHRSAPVRTPDHTREGSTMKLHDPAPHQRPRRRRPHPLARPRRLWRRGRADHRRRRRAPRGPTEPSDARWTSERHGDGPGGQTYGAGCAAGPDRAATAPSTAWPPRRSPPPRAPTRC